MRKLRIRLLVLLAVFALIATACAGESTSTDEVDTDAPAATEAPDEPDESPEATDAPDDEPDDTESEPEGEDETASEGVFAEDFHGGIFADFQASYDRSTDPFSTLDAFCTEHEAAADRTDSMDGVTADTINIGHAFQDLSVVATLGFAVPVGDPILMFETFAKVINEQCGGIRGRQLVVQSATTSPLADAAAENTRACIELTEDFKSAWIMNSTGGVNATGALCIAEEHGTIVSSSSNLADEIIERGEDRILTIPLSQDDGNRALVRRAAAEGLLDGKTIAVVYPDTPGIPESVEGTLIPELEAAGFAPAVTEVIGCEGGTSCATGLIEAVTKLKSEGVDAVFPPLNILSLPAFVAEMANQGFAPGEVTFFQSALNSQNGDLVSSKVVANGGPDAAALYNGTIIVDTPYTGLYQVSDTVPPFNDMCINTYADNGGEFHDYFSAEENTPSGMVTSVCTLMRVMARAMYHAGDNPTPESLADAIKNLGPVDLNSGIPGFVDGGGGMMAWPQTATWTSPCQYDVPFDENDTCVVSNGDFEPFER